MPANTSRSESPPTSEHQQQQEIHHDEADEIMSIEKYLGDYGQPFFVYYPGYETLPIRKTPEDATYYQTEKYRADKPEIQKILSLHQIAIDDIKFILQKTGDKPQPTIIVHTDGIKGCKEIWLEAAKAIYEAVGRESHVAILDPKKVDLESFGYPFDRRTWTVFAKYNAVKMEIRGVVERVLGSGISALTLDSWGSNNGPKVPAVVFFIRPGVERVWNDVLKELRRICDPIGAEVRPSIGDSWPIRKQ